MSGSLGRDYRTLLAALTLSNLADGMIRTALPLLAVRLTASATLVATVTMVATLPWLVFALPAGAVIGDRPRGPQDDASVHQRRPRGPPRWVRSHRMGRRR